MSEYLDSDAYADFDTGQETTLKGGHAWWANIIPKDRERIAKTVQEHADTYRRLGYKVALEVGAGSKNIDLKVDFAKEDRTKADIEILKGALGATLIAAGWGGGG